MTVRGPDKAIQAKQNPPDLGEQAETMASTKRSWMAAPRMLRRRDRSIMLKLSRVATWLVVAGIISRFPSLGANYQIGSLVCIFVFFPTALLIEQFVPGRRVDLFHTVLELVGHVALASLLPLGFGPAAVASAVSTVANSQHFGRLKYLLVVVAACSFAIIGSYRNVDDWTVVVLALLVMPLSGIQLLTLFSKQLESISSRINLITASSDAFLWEYNQETRRFENFEGNLAGLFASGSDGLERVLANSADLRQLVVNTTPSESNTAVIRLDAEHNKPAWFRFTTLGKVAENGDRYIQGFALDVTELEGSRISLRQRAERDSLTGLPNRDGLVSFLKGFEGPFQESTMTAIFMIDIDRFKDINDTLGHQVGDRVIAALAVRFSSLVTDTCCVARLGGDEFAIALVADQETVETEAAALANHVLESSRTRLAIDELELATSASVGYSISNECGWQEQLKEADIAMYEAKRSGVGVGMFSETGQFSNCARFNLQAELGKRLEEQIELWFQPIVDAQTLQVTSLECLARWVRDGDIIFPKDFLGLIESAGLTTRFDRHVLNAAAHTAAYLEILDKPISVSANISARSLWSSELSKQLQSMNSRERSHLTIEITEQGLLDDHLRIAPTLTTFRLLGFQLALDDYGTGASSLIRLRNLPFTQIKIDRSFVAGICKPGADRSIVRSSLDLARELGLETVAEGVETVEQAELLIEWGCDYLQGYLFAEAVPFDDLHLGRYDLDRITVKAVGPANI